MDFSIFFFKIPEKFIFYYCLTAVRDDRCGIRLVKWRGKCYNGKNPTMEGET